jgi:metal-responsive CopG/Arc/MetJ family transcriptional regulator
MVRLQPDDLATLDDYIREQRDALTRPEAIRQLLRIALDERWKWQANAMVDSLANRRKRR